MLRFSSYKNTSKKSCGWMLSTRSDVLFNSPLSEVHICRSDVKMSIPIYYVLQRRLATGNGTFHKLHLISFECKVKDVSRCFQLLCGYKIAILYPASFLQSHETFALPFLMIENDENIFSFLLRHQENIIKYFMSIFILWNHLHIKSAIVRSTEQRIRKYYLWK